MIRCLLYFSFLKFSQALHKGFSHSIGNKIKKQTHPYKLLFFLTREDIFHKYVNLLSWKLSVQFYIPFTDSDFEYKTVIHASLFFPIITGKGCSVFFFFRVVCVH